MPAHPDGDVVRYLRRNELASLHPGWSCYHTELWTAEHAGVTFGVVGCAVGAPFAVLVAEQLAASGCELVVSITSSGQVTSPADPPYYLLIEQAWRDEGTSLHYVPPEPWSPLRPELAERVVPAFARLDEEVTAGAAWTTDAPYRETETAIAAARHAGCHVVEMEAAALYAYAHARGQDVVCLAHVTTRWRPRALTSRRAHRPAPSHRSTCSRPWRKRWTGPNDSGGGPTGPAAARSRGGEPVGHGSGHSPAWLLRRL